MVYIRWRIREECRTLPRNIRISFGLFYRVKAWCERIDNILIGVLHMRIDIIRFNDNVEMRYLLQVQTFLIFYRSPAKVFKCIMAQLDVFLDEIFVLLHLLTCGLIAKFSWIACITPADDMILFFLRWCFSDKFFHLFLLSLNIF